ncbi:hypothetical protein LU11_gp389 [Pseudomonas phage Lu11]|uniref:hypothetical protein n=1 Tax=Pseudomonas phage Lu11 TaxID=1161927 RepID=UPI00025F18E2|nr:hypothetical protein LU11_gp389 [Pseudomonas phage Lu11]AFH14920.1 hypothetical protein Lu11_0382 [Pseudomonas phage Lu11]
MNNVIKQTEATVFPVLSHADQMEFKLRSLVDAEYLSKMRDSVFSMIRNGEYDEDGKQALATYTLTDGGPNVWVHFAQGDDDAEPNFEALRHGAVIRTGTGWGAWMRFIDGLGFRDSNK